jgi:hypothetical protein
MCINTLHKGDNDDYDMMMMMIIIIIIKIICGLSILFTFEMSAGTYILENDVWPVVNLKKDPSLGRLSFQFETTAVG